MHLILAILTLSASSLAAVVPRSQYGAWDVAVSKSAYANGFKSQTVSAIFTSDSYPEGIKSTCKYVYNPASEPKESSECDNEAFSYQYDGQSKLPARSAEENGTDFCVAIKLQQVVDEPSKQTVFGNASLTLKSDAVGRTFTGETTVDVTSAIA